MSRLSLELYDEVSGSAFVLPSGVTDLNAVGWADRAARIKVVPGDNYRVGDHVRLLDAVNANATNVRAIDPDVEGDVDLNLIDFADKAAGVELVLNPRLSTYRLRVQLFDTLAADAPPTLVFYDWDAAANALDLNLFHFAGKAARVRVDKGPCYVDGDRIVASSSSDFVEWWPGDHNLNDGGWADRVVALQFKLAEAAAEASKPVIFVDSSFPEVLVVIDDGLFMEGEVDFEGLLSALSCHVDCPIGRGTHDFWVIHPRPKSKAGFFSPRERLDFRPQPLRGLIRTGHQLPQITVDIAQRYMRTFAEEIAHYWLLWSSLRINETEIAGDRAFLNPAVNGDPLPEYPLGGRADGHWSYAFQADASPMDGIHFDRLQTIELPPGHSESEIVEVLFDRIMPGVQFDVPTLGKVDAVQSYNDLDLYLMGVLLPGEMYAQSDHHIEFIEPKWLFPSIFRAGLLLVFSQGDVLTFGYRNHLQTLGVDRTGSTFSQTLNLHSVYEPWIQERRMFLRVVRKGDDYHFQARPDWRFEGSGGVVTPEPFSDLDVLAPPTPSPQDWTTWRTLLKLTIPDQLMAIGYVTASDQSRVLDVSFSPLEVATLTQVARPTTWTIEAAGSPVAAANYFNQLTREQFLYHRPKHVQGKERVTFRSDSGRLRLISYGTFEHSLPSPGVVQDELPKLVAKAPSGDFVAAGSVRVERLIVAPWAAGSVVGHTLWGYPRRVATSQLMLTKQHAARRKYDPGKPYRGAYIVVAPHRQHVTYDVLRNVDFMRRASESFFFEATRQYRELDTRLVWWE